MRPNSRAAMGGRVVGRRAVVIEDLDLFLARTGRGTVYAVGVHRYVVRIRLPDRPGALGQVASRIGAVGGDIVAIDILERAEGRAIDEFVLELDGDHLVELLRTEIHEVDGVQVEDVRRVEPEPAATDD